MYKGLESNVICFFYWQWTDLLKMGSVKTNKDMAAQFNEEWEKNCRDQEKTNKHSFHVIIYSFWLIHFTPLAKVITAEMPHTAGFLPPAGLGRNSPRSSPRLEAAMQFQWLQSWLAEKQAGPVLLQWNLLLGELLTKTNFPKLLLLCVCVYSRTPA